MRTGGFLHRGRKLTCVLHPTTPVVLDTVLIKVRAHCAACGEHATITGDSIREITAGWFASHWAPRIDEVDIGTAAGGLVGTWRNTATR